jgi:hypothetical protein
MPLPIRFDINEFFLIAMTAIGFFIVFKLPNKLPVSIGILNGLWCTTIARISDHMLASAELGAHLDFYDVIDSGKFEFFDMLPYVIYYLYGYIMIYIYKSLNIKRAFIPLFVLITSLLSILFEYLMVIFKVYNYRNWTLLYSLNVYLFVYPLTLLFYHYIDYLYKKMKNSHA